MMRPLAGFSVIGLGISRFKSWSLLALWLTSSLVFGRLPASAQTTVTQTTSTRPVTLPGSPGTALSLQIHIAAGAACPTGYIADQTTPHNIHLTICVVDQTAFKYCSAQRGYYECGVNASECCPAYADNQCFAGAYACSLPADRPGDPRRACCISK